MKRLSALLLILLSLTSSYAANDTKLDAQTQQKAVDRVKEYCQLMQEFSADVEKIDNMETIYGMCENNNVSVFNDLAEASSNVSDNAMPLQQYMMLLTDKFENNVKTSYSGFQYLKAIVQPSPLEGFDAATYAFVKVDKEVEAPGIKGKHHLNIIVNTATMKVSSTTSEDFEDPQGIYLKALEKYNNNDFKAAIPLFEKVSVLQRFPGRYRAKSMLGWIYADQDNHEKANSVLREAAEEDPLGKILLSSKILLSNQVPVFLRNTTEGVNILQALGEVHDKEIPQMHLMAKVAMLDASLDFKTARPIIVLPQKEKGKLADDLISDSQSTDLFLTKGYMVYANIRKSGNAKELKEGLSAINKAESLFKKLNLSPKAKGELSTQISLTKMYLLEATGDKAGANQVLKKMQENPYALPTLALMELMDRKIDGPKILDLYRRAAEHGDPFSTYIVSLSHYPSDPTGKHKGGWEKIWMAELYSSLNTIYLDGWLNFCYYLITDKNQNRSPEEFRKWNQKAIDLGNVNAMEDRAIFEAWNIAPYQNVDKATALERACKAAVVKKETGNKLNLAYLGCRLRGNVDEIKVPVEKSQTCQILKSLDEQGNGAASYLLFTEFYHRNNEELSSHYLERSKDAAFYYGIYDYARYLMEIKEYEQALRLLNKLTTYPRSGAYHCMGEIEVARQNYKQAVKYYEIGMGDNDYECFEAMSDLSKKIGGAKNIKDAKDYIDKAIIVYNATHFEADESSAGKKRLLDKQKELETLLSGGKPSSPAKPQQTPAPAPARTGNQAATTSSNNDIQMPQYPSGINGLISFLSENINYPEDAEKQGIEGKVIVSFVVDTDGTIKDAEVVQKVYPSLDAEAVRVIMSMPKWKPATKQGVPVRVRYKLPISFALPSSE